MIIGLTGSIGAGKSTVAQFLRDFGAHVIDADEVAKEAVSAGSDGLNSLVKNFGDAILNEDGSLNRKQLAALVFNDKSKLEKMNAILLPWIVDTMLKRAYALEKQGKTVVMDAPLLFECSMHKRVDTTWVVTADYDRRIERIIKRSGFTKKEAEKRSSAQMEDRQKIINANLVIPNNGDKAELRENVLKAYKNLKGE